MDPREELRTHLRPAAIVGTALIASLVVDLALVEVLRSVLKPFRGFVGTAGLQPLRLGLFAAAAAVVLVILVLRHRLFRLDPGEDAAAALGRLQRATIVVLVLGEIPAVLGLALFLIGGNAVDFYALLFASLVLTFIDFPRRAAWEDMMKGCPLCQGRTR
jgi:hypothetical protein